MPNLDPVRDLGLKIMDRLRKDPGPFDHVEMESKVHPAGSNKFVHTIHADTGRKADKPLRIGVGGLNPQKDPETLAAAIRRMGELPPAPKPKAKPRKKAKSA